MSLEGNISEEVSVTGMVSITGVVYVSDEIPKSRNIIYLLSGLFNLITYL